MCVNMSHTERLQCQAKVGEPVRILRIAVHRGKISVDFLGDAVSLKVFHPEAHDGLGGFGFNKLEHAPAGSIIDGNQKCATGTAVFEPRMIASIELNKRPNGGASFTTLSMGPGFSVKRPKVFGQQPPTESFRSHEDIMFLLK